MNNQQNRLMAIGAIVVLAVVAVLATGSLGRTTASTNAQSAATMAATTDMNAMATMSSTMSGTMISGGAYPPCPTVMAPTMSATMGADASMMAPTMAATMGASASMMAPTMAATMAMGTSSASMAPTMYVSTTGTPVPGCSLSAVLAGPNEMPKQGDPKGKGTATVMLSRPATGPGVVCFVIQVSGITLPATAAHIHIGAMGVPGPVVVPLKGPDASGNATGCTQNVDPNLIMAILTQPSNYYVNVHNADFPGGVMRGQLAVSGQ